jgi:chromosome segregation ATPase
VGQSDAAHSDMTQDTTPLEQRVASPLSIQPIAKPVDLGLTLTSADYQGLLDELAVAQALDRERVNRIHHLEQALDQALVCLEELRSQLNDQSFLEEKLASTEEYSHVQQQAILRLKLQLAEQQQVLDVQVLETQQRDQAIQELMATIESMTQAQQQELERLRSYIAQDQVEGQNHRHLLGQQIRELQTSLESRQQRISELESETLSARTLTASLREQLATAQQQIKDLSVRLRQHQADWAQLEAQLAEVQQERTHAVIKAQPSIASTQLATVSQELNLAHRRIETLENQLAQQVRLHSHWQQSHQQMEEERDRLQTRLTGLEQQTAEMQEQILHQAQQATEYETAVQYWKDRYIASSRQVSHLRELVENTLTQQSGAIENDPALLDLFNAMLAALPAEPQEIPAAHGLALPRLHPPELPDFLVRRRSPVREQGG